MKKKITNGLKCFSETDISNDETGIVIKCYHAQSALSSVKPYKIIVRFLYRLTYVRIRCQTLRAPAKHPEPSGRYADIPLENAGEIALIFKAGPAGDLGEGQIRSIKIGFASLDAQLVQIFGEGTPGLLFDDAAQVGSRKWTCAATSSKAIFSVKWLSI